MRDRVQALRIGLAELDQPAIVGPGVGGGQCGVGDVSFPADADRRVEQDAVDALGIHHAQGALRIVTAGRAALGVGHLPLGQQVLHVHLDAAERAELASQCLQRSAVDQEHLVAVRVRVDADGPIPIRRVEVPDPGVGGLQHVTVGIDDSSRGGGRHGRIVHGGRGGVKARPAAIVPA